MEQDNEIRCQAAVNSKCLKLFTGNFTRGKMWFIYLFIYSAKPRNPTPETQICNPLLRNKTQSCFPLDTFQFIFPPSYSVLVQVDILVVY